ncbi:MAG: 2TM domain-containing protein [Nostocaceae cyanobacterium CSU_2_110]|nr:2TM domain-containing protein [Nostocaceae cyanobacterium CSU_2_110]
MTTEDKIKYEQAVQQVTKIKGFYSHLLVYLIVNLMIVVVNIQNLKPDESYFRYTNFITAFFWGIGLLFHAIKVFVPNFLFGSNWENKKLRRLWKRKN